jgi:flagellin
MSIINTNLGAIAAQNSLRTSGLNQTTAMERLSSGIRINSAKDDAAGLAISMRMTANIRGLNAAIRNANDGISLTQTAEGSLASIGDNLQRIRELAVQSANTGNSDSDRNALNTEARQLVSEIDRIANNSQFNGIKLLDGSFQNQSLQVGAGNDANDRIAISIGSAKVSALGIGSNSSYSKVLNEGDKVTNVALTAGALSINGAQIGASSSDGVSYTNADSSAIAKAAAINAASGLTGVTATVSKTEVTGSPAGNSGAIAAGEVLINGVDIGAIGASNSPVERGVQTAAAINAKTSQTGVTATASTSTGAVVLTAADGRNITVSSTTAGGEATGLKTTVVAPNAPTTAAATGAFKINGIEIASVTVGTNPVTVTQKTDGVVAVAADAAATPPVVAVTGVKEVDTVKFKALTAGQKATVGGLTFTAGKDGISAVDLATEFKGRADGATGLTSTKGVFSGTLTGFASAAATSGATDKDELEFTSTANAATNITSITTAAFHGSSIAAAINAKSDQTGVTAVSNDTTGVLTLSIKAKDGRGIEITGDTAGTGLAVMSSSTTATIKLSTNGDKGIVIGGDDGASSTGQTKNRGFNASVLSSSGGVDLSTAAGSQAALSVLDKAINTVTDSRASMGAYQNRLTASVANLEITSMNLQASRSRILDTDYAKETTNLAKSQIIQQAATAMLAQANQSAQSVLALLK